MRSSNDNVFVYFFVFVFIMSLVFCGWVGTSYLEAKSYNKLVQPEVEATTWDAMFTELRVTK